MKISNIKKNSKDHVTFLFITFAAVFLVLLFCPEPGFAAACSPEAVCDVGTCIPHYDNTYSCCGDGVCDSGDDISCPEDCGGTGEAPYCDSSCNPAGCIYGDYGKYDGRCYPSCAKLGGNICSDTACIGRTLLGTAYDCHYVKCCNIGATKYKCSGTSCVADPSGTYTTSNCNNQCSGGGTTQCNPPRWDGNYVDACWDINGGSDCSSEKQKVVADWWCQQSVCGSTGASSYTTQWMSPGVATKFVSTGRVCQNCNNVLASVACGGGGGLCTQLSPRPSIGYGPYTTFDTEKRKAWRISMCFHPPMKSDPANFKTTMENWVAAYNTAFDPDVQRKPGGSDTTDAILFPGDGLVDVIEAAGTSNPKWAYFPTGGGCKEGSGPGGICSLPGPYQNIAYFTGYSENLLSSLDDNPQNAKYKAARVFICCEPSSDNLAWVAEKYSRAWNVQTDFKLPDLIDFKTGEDYIDVINQNNLWQWCVNCGVEEPGPTDCNDPTGKLPLISSIREGATLKHGDEFHVLGTDLTTTYVFIAPGATFDPNVGFIPGVYVYCGRLGCAGANFNSDCTVSTYNIPHDLPYGNYLLKIYKARDKISNGISIKIIGNVLKYTPEEDATGYCDEDSQCLLSVSADGIDQCINSGEYSNDNYCENGNWSSRTKLLALKLLKLKSGDYTLFCDNRENTLNNLQYLTGSNDAVANVLTNLQTNNFCVLKTGNAIIIGTSTNKNYEDVQNSLNIFGITSCSNARDDGNYYSCDNTNKVWYNKRLKSFIYSTTSITVPSDQVSFIDFIRNPIRAIVDAIKRLIVPSDQASLNAIKKFSRLYMTQQGTKSVMALIEGRNPVNAVIEYNNFDTDICKFIGEYSKTKVPDLSILSCKKEANKYYVLAQGSQLTNLNPEVIWSDLTSKLRLR